jgi:hypothetical protein
LESYSGNFAFRSPQKQTSRIYEYTA